MEIIGINGSQKLLGRTHEEIMENLSKDFPKTEDYIKKYLTPGYEWEEEIQFNLKMKQIGKIKDKEKVAEYIKSMKYKDFLNTKYWKAITHRVKTRAEYHCQICDSKGKMEVHHKTYENHGYEYDFWETDLICLCEECHRKIHALEG